MVIRDQEVGGSNPLAPIRVTKTSLNGRGIRSHYFCEVLSCASPNPITEIPQGKHRLSTALIARSRQPRSSGSRRAPWVQAGHRRRPEDNAWSWSSTACKRTRRRGAPTRSSGWSRSTVRTWRSTSASPDGAAAITTLRHGVAPAAYFSSLILFQCQILGVSW
jgi:hypothetical protein